MRSLPFRRHTVPLLLVLLLLGTGNAFAQGDGTSVIQIQNAERTEYAKNPASGDEEIVLTGNVRVSVTQGESVTVISAAVISYNRRTNMLSAQGGVTLTATGGSGGAQDVTAASLLFNTSTLEGVFDNGRVVQTQSDAINLPSDATLIVSSDLFGKGSSGGAGTITFKNATLTFCDAPDPHWKIWASKIWLLPGGEFAFFNAVLFVGHVPVMYLPAFYYPKDELLFNPSFGYDQRRGYYLQTTTYLVGRKPLGDSSGDGEDDEEMGEGIFNFMRATTLKEQRREGLILHNLDADFTGDTTTYLKVMADYYTTLGGMIGVEGKRTPGPVLSQLEGGLRLGFTSTVFYDSFTDSYLPYSSAGSTYADNSHFLGLDLPFRYGADLAVTIRSPFQFRLQFPLYSDPYFEEDFGERSEYMDWISFLMSSAAARGDEDDSKTVTSFTWSATGAYSVPLPEAVKPYVSSARVTTLASSIVFNSKNSSLTAADDWAAYTPERSFYYPSQVTPLKAAASISGTLFQYPAQAARTAVPQFPVPLTVPGEFRAPEEEGGQPSARAGDGAAPVTGITLPLLDASLPQSAVSAPGVTYSLGYSVVPQYTSQLTYDAASLSKPEDFDWGGVQSSYYQLTAPVSLTSELSFRDAFLTMKNELSFTPAYQAHPSLDGYSAAAARSVRLADYTARKLDLVAANTLSVQPFVYVDTFRKSALTWDTSLLLLQAQFLSDRTDWEDNPQWKYLLPWHYYSGVDGAEPGDFITTHALTATVQADEDEGFSQKLVLAAVLPPQTEAYTAIAQLSFPAVSLAFSGGVKKDSSGGDWKKQPFQQSASVQLLDGALSFVESFNYDLENSHADSLRLSFAWQNLKLAYTMGYTYGYDFDDGWVARGEKEFLAQSLSLTYTMPSVTFRHLGGRVSWAPSLSTGITYDCLRPTESSFSFTPALTLRIDGLLDLTFSSESRNSVIYRYVQALDGAGIVLAGETNPLVDLWNSFSFWDEAKRRNSGFKLKSLKVTATHSLHDWDLAASLSVSPRLTTVSGRPQYSFDPYLTLSVVWRPLRSMKTEVVDDYGTWQLNP